MKFILFKILLLFVVSDIYAGNWRTFGCDIFSINYPSGWESVSTGHGNEVAIFTRKVNNPSQQPFAENVNIVYEIITHNNAPESLESAALNAFADIKALIPDIEIVSSGYKKIGNYEGYEMVFKGKFMDMDLKWKQVFFRQKHAWFVITYTGFGENFDYHEPTADNMIASFRIK